MLKTHSEFRELLSAAVGCGCCSSDGASDRLIAHNAALLARVAELEELLRDANSVECVNSCAVQRGSTVKAPIIRHTARCDKQRAALAEKE